MNKSTTLITGPHFRPQSQPDRASTIQSQAAHSD
jgi:hypothetical protein